MSRDCNILLWRKFSTFLLAARVGLQMFLLWIIVDLYQTSKRSHVIYAILTYSVVLVVWILDALFTS